MGNAASFVGGFFYQQLIYTPKFPKADLTGQTIIVTGSNVGLGLDAAQHFVRLNAAKVILAVRTESKGEDAKRTIINALGADSSRVEVWKLDMSSDQSVKNFADRVNQLDRLDAVVENAGVMSTEWKMLEGDESHIKVNVNSTVLLALLVLPKLRESGRKYKREGHLVLVGSDLHLMAKFKERNVKDKTLFEALNSEQDSDISDRYGSQSNFSPDVRLTLAQISNLKSPSYVRMSRTRRKTSRFRSISSDNKLLQSRNVQNSHLS